MCVLRVKYTGRQCVCVCVCLTGNTVGNIGHCSQIDILQGGYLILSKATLEKETYLAGIKLFKYILYVYIMTYFTSMTLN